MRKPLVYVAGPYSSNPAGNVRRAIEEAEKIEGIGAAVLIPHLSLLWDMVSPAPVGRWYERDLHLLERCDALVRIPGESYGADQEVAFAEERDIPVFPCTTAGWTRLCEFVGGYLAAA